MSIWGSGPFENDDGADWVDDLLDQPELEVLREPLEEVADPTHAGFIDVRDCCEAVAAAAVLADVVDTPPEEPELPEEDAEKLKAEFLAQSVSARQRLLRQALDALELVMNDEENSELRQLLEDDPEQLAEWIEVVQSLQARLLAVAGNSK